VSTPTGLRILLSEDHATIRTSLRKLLESASDQLTVVGEAATRSDTVRLARELSPDLVVLDLALPDVPQGKPNVGNGIAAIRQIVQHDRGVRVLVFTGLDQGIAKLSEAMSVGARGFVTKYAESDVLLAAVRGVARGELWVIIPQEYVRVVNIAPPADNLTPRERDVLVRLMERKDIPRIARELGLARPTVANYVTALLKKFEATRLIELVDKVEAQSAGEVAEDGRSTRTHDIN
jgi:DNA-binding NarL/FixJ family response regulator